jgi:beta-lactamase regulating signal transducer with metallopeptidase domain
MMNPDVGLQAASGLVNFLLKTTAEFAVCLVLVRLAGSARWRFNLWLTMLLAFVAQWIWMWADVARAAFPATIVADPVRAGTSVDAAEKIAVAAPLASRVAEIVGVLLVAYLAVVLWRLVGTLAARVRLARAMRYKSIPEGRLASAFQEVVEQSEAPGSALSECELWVLPGVSSPATLGWLRPRVIVPPACEGQDEEELKAVFWHELKHVERRDALWNAMVRACRNLLWFHPAVHHATRELNAQRELACDAAVVREHPHSRDVYAACLLRFARMSDFAPERSIPTIEMASNAELLKRRVRSILNEGPGMSRLSRAMRSAANLLLVGAMAATVPGLNILFEAQQRSAVQRLPIAMERPVMARSRVTGATVRRTAMVRGGEAASLPAAASSLASAPIAAALPHDDGLAAEHRAAMGILTESTGMDAPASTADRRQVASLSGSAGHPSAGRLPASWTSVAVDAAEHMGPLMSGDHDGDRH